MVLFLVDICTARSDSVRETLLRIVGELGKTAPVPRSFDNFQSSYRKTFRQVSADPQAWREAWPSGAPSATGDCATCTAIASPP